MSEKKFIEEFLIYEKDNDLLNLKVRGLPLWNIIRNSVYNEILKQKKNLKNSHYFDRSKKSKIIFYTLKKIPNYIFKNPILFNEKIDVLILNHNRKVKNNGVYECLYTDLLISHIDMSYIVIEEAYQGEHMGNQNDSNMYYSDYIRLVSAIKRKNPFRDKMIIENKILHSLLDNISEKFNVNLSKKDFQNNISNQIYSYKFMYPYYEKIIKKANPKVIVEVVSYKLQQVIVNDIASKLAIPTVELQHGTMGKNHFAYNYLLKDNISSFPEYVFTFGDYWKYNTRFPIEDKKVISVGWPYYEKRVEKFANNDFISNKKINILFISQGTIGDKLSQFACEVCKKINTEEYNIIYKLHPGEYSNWKTNYPSLLMSNIQVVDNNEYDMHYYFSKSVIQVGVYSTAIYEGLGYDLDTYIVKYNGYEHMEDLIKGNYVTLLNKADDFVKSINKRETQNYTINTNYFWKENSIVNIIEAIKSIKD